MVHRAQMLMDLLSANVQKDLLLTQMEYLAQVCRKSLPTWLNVFCKIDNEYKRRCRSVNKTGWTLYIVIERKTSPKKTIFIELIGLTKLTSYSKTDVRVGACFLAYDCDQANGRLMGKKQCCCSIGASWAEEKDGGVMGECEKCPDIATENEAYVDLCFDDGKGGSTLPHHNRFILV